MTTTSLPAVGAAAAVTGPLARRIPVWRALAAAGIAGSVAVAAGVGVWASLTATATNVTPQNMTSGTLKLELAANGAGFTQSVANLAPGDIVNRYVSLTNSGTVAAGPMSLSIAASGSAALLADAGTAKALRVSVDSCSVPWNAAAGTCGGSVTSELAPASLESLSTAAALAAITATAPGAAHHLRVSVQLPDQNENVVNGVLPAGSVQGASADLTYTFTHGQRTSTTSNS